MKIKPESQTVEKAAERQKNLTCAFAFPGKKNVSRVELLKKFCVEKTPHD